MIEYTPKNFTLNSTLNVELGICLPNSSSSQINSSSPIESMVHQFDWQMSLGFGLGRIVRKITDRVIHGVKNFTHKVKNLSPAPPQAVWVQAPLWPDESEGELGEMIKRKRNELIFNLSRDFDFKVSDNINKSIEICEILEKARKNGPIKLLIMSGHGTSRSITFGLGTERISVDQYYPTYTPRPGDLTCLSRYLDEDSTIILDSCETAGYKYLYNEMNMHRLIASFVPGSRVFAPALSIMFGSLHISYFFPFVDKLHISVYANQIDIEILDDKSHPKYHKVNEKYREGLSNSLSRKEYYDLLSEISPRNAFFCYKKETYESMHAYCDHPKVNLNPIKRPTDLPKNVTPDKFLEGRAKATLSFKSSENI